MNDKESKIVLSVEDLDAAAFLCLRHEAAADIHPEGTYEAVIAKVNRREHHERKMRFYKARGRLQRGRARTMGDLGLLPEDLNWAAEQADETKAPESWRYKFARAERALRQQTAN